jgi:hypothetical protein
LFAEDQTEKAKDFMSEPVSPLVHTDEAALAESKASEREDGSSEPARRRERSSAGERLLHTQDVAGSIPAVPTTPDPIADMLADEAWRLDVESRFWPKVARPLGWDECWPWTGAKKRRNGKQGYGGFKLAPRQTARAHRVSFALYYGRSPGPLLVCHHCDNPECVNPLHLFLGTVKDNSVDMVRKGRWKGVDQRGERNGAAKLSDAQVARIRDQIRAGLTNTAIAKLYGVTHQLISRIRRGRAWGEAAIHKPYEHLRRTA